MSFIIDINQDQFLEEVVEKSKTTPVIVDFWAPWCGPCKQLTPTLEKVVNKKNGKIILAKVNVDENQGIASQLNIQSIPTVYGFVDGKPIDAFQGAQPESKVEAMADKMIDASPGNEIPKLVEEANKLFSDQKFEDSLKLFESLIGMDAGNPKIISGMLRCLIQLKRINDAKEMFESLDEKIIEAIRAWTDLQKGRNISGARADTLYNFMDSTKLILIFGMSILIYLAFMFLGFFLRNKNLKAQNLKKD